MRGGGGLAGGEREGALRTVERERVGRGGGAGGVGGGGPLLSSSEAGVGEGFGADGEDGSFLQDQGLMKFAHFIANIIIITVSLQVTCRVLFLCLSYCFNANSIPTH